mgnify:CR=1 FL=1
MLKDIENARRLGADGVVFGCLTAEGDVDIPLMEQLMKASQGMSVTFHRAFDVCRNPQKAIEEYYRIRMQPHPNFRTATYSRARHSPSERTPTTSIRPNHPIGRLWGE